VTIRNGPWPRRPLSRPDLELVDAAWFLLIGIVVGQVLQLLRELVLERRREAKALLAEKRKSEREEDGYRRQMRQARRLVADELDSIAGQFAMVIRRGVSPPSGVDGFLDTSEWGLHKGALAESLENDAEFDLLASFYYTVNKARESLIRRGNQALGTQAGTLQLMETQARVLGNILLEQDRLPPEWAEEREEVRHMRLERAKDALDQYGYKPFKDPVDFD